MKDGQKSLCPLCGGKKKPGETTYSVDLKTGVIVVRKVPASVCDQCGEAWIGAEVARRLQALTQEARSKGAQIEVIALESGG